MPVYEYRCGDCNSTFDLFTPVRMSTEGVVCRRCHSANVRKLISVFASVGTAGEGSFSDDGFADAGTGGGGCCGGSCGCSH